jgi:hypothetical protein
MTGRLLEELRMRDLRRYGDREAYRTVLLQRIKSYDPEGKKSHVISEEMDKQGD